VLSDRLALFSAILQRDALKTLTMTDPWATLVALGSKRIETRSWATPYRGALAIHVAKSLPMYAEGFCEEPVVQHLLDAAGYTLHANARNNPRGLPLGCIVALVWLDDVQRIAPDFPADSVERAFGNFAPGRYAWTFSQCYRLTEPLPARGALGIWDWQPPAHFWQEIQAAHDRLREEVQR
jgi:hypothetical protein